MTVNNYELHAIDMGLDDAKNAVQIGVQRLLNDALDDLSVMVNESDDDRASIEHRVRALRAIRQSFENVINDIRDPAGIETVTIYSEAFKDFKPTTVSVRQVEDIMDKVHEIHQKYTPCSAVPFYDLKQDTKRTFYAQALNELGY